ncbi:MAG: hypothetical protein ACI9VN_003993 [Patescibacteria group bacterium]|jgi:hypothetical protein
MYRLVMQINRIFKSRRERRVNAPKHFFRISLCGLCALCVSIRINYNLYNTIVRKHNSRKLMLIANS